MQNLLDRIPGRERLRIACALIFWAATYLLFLTWNQLQDEFPSAIWQTRRLLATLIGALIFFGFTRIADRVSGRSLRDRALILTVAGIASVALLIMGRAAISLIISSTLNEPGLSLARHLRFAMIWSGYFAGGALAFIAFAPALHGATDDAADRVSHAANDDVFADALWVSRGRETVRVPVDTIDWIEAEGDYVRLHANGSGGLMRGTLTSLEETLDPHIFAPVHRSAICRRSAIAAMLRKPTGAIAVRLESGAEVPVGRRYRDSVAALLTPAKDNQRRLMA
ncbi:MAG: LytTR family transcriptional regulator [Proteobacteria bacterium]|nr:LytTR family transcriptional regulator [Pseudomonadota bacterium]